MSSAVELAPISMAITLTLKPLLADEVGEAVPSVEMPVTSTARAALQVKRRRLLDRQAEAKDEMDGNIRVAAVQQLYPPWVT
jgi:pyocin large subunit-like protein